MKTCNVEKKLVILSNYPQFIKLSHEAVQHYNKTVIKIQQIYDPDDFLSVNFQRNPLPPSPFTIKYFIQPIFSNTHKKTSNQHSSANESV